MSPPTRAGLPLTKNMITRLKPQSKSSIFIPLKLFWSSSYGLSADASIVRRSGPDGPFSHLDHVHLLSSSLSKDTRLTQMFGRVMRLRLKICSPYTKVPSMSVNSLGYWRTLT